MTSLVQSNRGKGSLLPFWSDARHDAIWPPAKKIKCFTCHAMSCQLKDNTSLADCRYEQSQFRCVCSSNQSACFGLDLPSVNHGERDPLDRPISPAIRRPEQWERSAAWWILAAIWSSNISCWGSGSSSVLHGLDTSWAERRASPEAVHRVAGGDLGLGIPTEDGSRNPGEDEARRVQVVWQFEAGGTRWSRESALPLQWHGCPNHLRYLRDLHDPKWCHKFDLMQNKVTSSQEVSHVWKAYELWSGALIVAHWYGKTSPLLCCCARHLRVCVCVYVFSGVCVSATMMRAGFQHENAKTERKTQREENTTTNWFQEMLRDEKAATCRRDDHPLMQWYLNMTCTAIAVLCCGLMQRSKEMWRIQWQWKQFHVCDVVSIHSIHLSTVFLLWIVSHLYNLI